VKSVAVLLIASFVASPLLADDSGAPVDASSPTVSPRSATEREEAAFMVSFADSFLAAEASMDAAGSDDQSAEPQPSPQVTEEPQKPAPPKEPPPKRPSLKPADFWKDLKVEAKRYLADSFALVTAPAHWNVADWERFGGAAIVIGGLMLEDRHLDHEFQKWRSTFTNRVSDATTSFGGGYGVNTGVAFLIVGYVFRSWDLRETGRETLEAGFLSNLLDKWILKRAIGRERPQVSNGRTVFRPGSSNDSFPSGHATEAFAVASVIAVRSKGWVLPTIAYTAATLVAFDRVNDRVHFPSDVAAGAILGTAVGRFLVARHRRAQGQAPAPTVVLVPIRGGLAAKVDF
jgi:membrane-associated phospholipid phosphatase